MKPQRDYPILLGTHPCPECGEWVETEYLFASEDPSIKIAGSEYLHLWCWNRMRDEFFPEERE